MFFIVFSSLSSSSSSQLSQFSPEAKGSSIYSKPESYYDVYTDAGSNNANSAVNGGSSGGDAFSGWEGAAGGGAPPQMSSRRDEGAFVVIVVIAICVLSTLFVVFIFEFISNFVIVIGVMFVITFFCAY